MGDEVGDEGTPHFQGRAVFRASKRMNAIKKLLSVRMHLEMTKAIHDWSYLYKGDVFIDVNFKKQGKRSDLEAVAEDVRSGMSLDDVAREHPVSYIRYHKGIAALQTKIAPAKTPKRRWRLEDFHEDYQYQLDWNKFERKSIICFGPTGTGKTSYWVNQFKKPLMCRHVDDLKQLNRDHDGIIFDDMSFTHMPREAQIHLVDYEQSSTIHARYTNATIPEGMPRVFLTNEPNGLCVDLNDPAIRRRCNVMHIYSSYITNEEACPCNDQWGQGNEDGCKY